MATPIASAIAAYGKTAAPGQGMEARDTGKNFANTLMGMLDESAQSMKAAEGQTVSALSGKTDLVDVIQAIQRAEMNLTAVVTIRDKVINGYQEIMRMPI